MTPNPHKHDDTKILLAVAGAVVAGAAALALLAGLGTSDGPESAPVSRAEVDAERRPEPRPADTLDAVMPVVGIRESGEPVRPAVVFESIVDAGPVEPEIDVIEIAPGENLVAGGLAAWNAGDYRRAAAYFAAQVAARETDAWAQYMLGLSLWKDGRADDAVTAMRKSAEIDPTFIRTPLNLARIENDRGDFEAALTASRAALALEPDHAEAKFLEGRSLNNLDRRDEAIAALERSVELDDSNGYAHNLLGLVLLASGDAEAAADAFERAAERVPEVAFVQNNLGMAYEHCGDRAAAVAAYRRAVELDTGHARAARNLARLEPTVPVASPDDGTAVAGTTEPLPADVTANLGDVD